MGDPGDTLSPALLDRRLYRLEVDVSAHIKRQEERHEEVLGAVRENTATLGQLARRFDAMELRAKGAVPAFIPRETTEPVELDAGTREIETALRRRQMTIMAGGGVGLAAILTILAEILKTLVG